MLWKERTDEEIEKFIEKTAERIIKYDLVTPAILFFESIKPIAPIVGRLGGAAFAWLIPFIGHTVDDYFAIFREPENIEKLLRLIEEKNKEKMEKDKGDKGKKRKFHLF